MFYPNEWPVVAEWPTCDDTGQFSSLLADFTEPMGEMGLCSLETGQRGDPLLYPKSQGF